MPNRTPPKEEAKAGARLKPEAIATTGSGNDRPGLLALLARTRDAIGDAARARPGATIFYVVFAVVMLGASIRALFLGDETAAVFFIATPIALAYLLSPLVPNARERQPGMRLIPKLMAWGFSLILLVGAAALAVQSVGCRFGYFCKPTVQATQPPAVTFSLLDENALDKSKPEAFVLREAKRPRRDTVRIPADGEAAIIFVTTVDGLATSGKRGKFDAEVELWAGPDATHLKRLGAISHDAQSWRSGETMITRYPGGPDKLARDLKEQGLVIEESTILVLTAVSLGSCKCIPPEMLKEILNSPTATFVTIVTDKTTGAMTRREIQVQFARDRASR